MLNCAYCDKSCQQTREHVIPEWYNDTPGDAETFSARAPLTHIKGDLVVKDVCGTCNNEKLSSLDGYGKELYDRSFASPVYADDTVSFAYDGDRLLRWLLKLSYNSARAQNADIRVLREYRKVMLGEAPIDGRIRCWLHLVTATCFDANGGIARPARRSEAGQPNVDEPLWFRIAQFRMPSHPAISLVQRSVLINSFAFTLLIARIDADWPSPEFDQWITTFTNGYPAAQPILFGERTLTMTASDDHAAASLAFLQSNYSSRFSDDPNPFVVQALKSLKTGAPLVMLHVPRDLTDTGDTTPIAAALRQMVSTCENAAAFRQRVAVMVDGFDDDPRELWQVPHVRQFFRRLFIECPFVMLVAHPDRSLLKLFACCWLYEDDLTPEVEQQRMQEFLDHAFRGLNSLNHTVVLSEEQNKEICMAAAKALLGEVPPST